MKRAVSIHSCLILVLLCVSILIYPRAGEADLLGDLAKIVLEAGVNELTKDEKAPAEEDDENQPDSNAGYHAQELLSSFAGLEARSIRVPDQTLPVTVHYYGDALYLPPEIGGPELIALGALHDTRPGESGGRPFLDDDIHRYFALTAIRNSPAVLPQPGWGFTDERASYKAWMYSRRLLDDILADFFVVVAFTGFKFIGNNEFEERRTFANFQKFYASWRPNLTDDVPDLPIKTVSIEQGSLPKYDHEFNSFYTTLGRIKISAEDAETLIDKLGPERRLYVRRQGLIREVTYNNDGPVSLIGETTEMYAYTDSAMTDLLGYSSGGYGSSASFRFSEKYAHLAFGSAQNVASVTPNSSPSNTAPPVKVSDAVNSGRGSMTVPLSSMFERISLETFDGIPLERGSEKHNADLFRLMFLATAKSDAKLFKALTENPDNWRRISMLGITNLGKYCQVSSGRCTKMLGDNEFDQRRTMEQFSMDLSKALQTVPDFPFEVVSVQNVVVSTYDYESGGYAWSGVTGTGGQFFGFLKMAIDDAEAWITSGEPEQLRLKSVRNVTGMTYRMAQGKLGVGPRRPKPTYSKPVSAEMLVVSPRKTYAKIDLPGQENVANCFPSAGKPEELLLMGNAVCVPAVGQVSNVSLSARPKELGSRTDLKLDTIQPKMLADAFFFRDDTLDKSADNRSSMFDIARYIQLATIKQRPDLLADGNMARSAAYHMLPLATATRYLDVCPRSNPCDWSISFSNKGDATVSIFEGKGFSLDFRDARKSGKGHYVRWKGETEFALRRSRDAFVDEWTPVFKETTVEMPFSIVYETDVFVPDYDFEQGGFSITVPSFGNEISAIMQHKLNIPVAFRIHGNRRDEIVFIPMDMDAAETLLGNIGVAARCPEMKDIIQASNLPSNAIGGMCGRYRKLAAILMLEVRDIAEIENDSVAVESYLRELRILRPEGGGSPLFVAKLSGQTESTAINPALNGDSPSRSVTGDQLDGDRRGNAAPTVVNEERLQHESNSSDANGQIEARKQPKVKTLTPTNVVVPPVKSTMQPNQNLVPALAALRERCDNHSNPELKVRCLEDACERLAEANAWQEATSCLEATIRAKMELMQMRQ